MVERIDITSMGQRSANRRAPMPRELAVAAGMLVAIMIMMSLALWFVAGTTNQQHGRSGSAPALPLPTEQLLRTLADDLGANATEAHLEQAVAHWLSQQTDTRTLVPALAQETDAAF